MDKSKEDQKNAEKAHNLCEERLKTALYYNFDIQRMVYAIEDLGCKLPSGFFSCKSCSDDSISGGFVAYTGEKDYKPAIVICEDNQIPYKDAFESTIIHELVHAYDFCRAKINTADCIQHACTEIRASNMSGECNYTTELMRGNTALQGSRRDCVKRRAELSVAMNPACKDIAKKAVDEAFAKCYADKAPLQSTVPYVD